MYQMKGRGRVTEVLDIVYSSIKHLLSDVDYRSTRNGEFVWRNAARWARKRLIEDGSLKGDSERGIWELTEQGIKAAECDSA